MHITIYHKSGVNPFLTMEIHTGSKSRFHITSSGEKTLSCLPSIHIIAMINYYIRFIFYFMHYILYQNIFIILYNKFSYINIYIIIS